GIAFSLFDFHNPDYSSFQPYIASIVQYVHKNPMPLGTLLNVNFPMANEKKEYKLKLTRQGRQYWMEDPSHEQEGAFMMNVKLSQVDDHAESDSFWLSKGYITASPVHVDELTDWRYLKAKKEEFESIFS
ncbi:MAG TPA: 5'/3'-nucleotidase SurE, partial [Chlamydiales bacterium]|nr:5'/3'-nucleotidase SurE [Chlamydiales bacterium]